MCSAGSRIRRRLDLYRDGWSRARVDRAVATGTLVRLRRGIYADADTCTPRRTAAQHGGALACVTAARHLGLWVLTPSGDQHVGLTHDGHGLAHAACACVEHWDQDRTDRFATPGVIRILRQILLCRGVEEFFVAVESALHLRAIAATDIPRLASGLSADARRALQFARDDAESGLESLLRWRLRHLHLDVRTQVSVYSVGRVDLLVGDALIIEVDGVENHGGADHRHKDLRRDARAAAWGFVTLRFDYALVVHDWPTVEAAILGLLTRGLHRR